MNRAQLVSMLASGWILGRAALLIVAVLGVVAAPSSAPAQDAGVSGIPPGPANARGLNGSVNDPSGIGNAARMPALPSPTITPVVPPTVSSPLVTRSSPVQGVVRVRRAPTHVARSRAHRTTAHHATASRVRGAARAAVDEQDRLLDHRVLSICRGC